MQIRYVYNPATQEKIDYLEGRISDIKHKYESKINNPQTLEDRTNILRPECRKMLMRNCIEEMKPYQEKLAEVHSKSIPKIIVER